MHACRKGRRYKQGVNTRAHLGGLKASGADIALPKDALIPQNAVGLVLLVVQEVAELLLARLLCVHLHSKDAP